LAGGEVSIVLHLAVVSYFDGEDASALKTLLQQPCGLPSRVACLTLGEGE
jgi:hypothetical protein